MAHYKRSRPLALLGARVRGVTKHVLCALLTAAFSKIPGFKEDQKLTSFIDDRVRPSPEEMSSLNGAVDTVVRYLHEFKNAVPGQNYKVKKVVKVRLTTYYLTSCFHSSFLFVQLVLDRRRLQ